MLRTWCNVILTHNHNHFLVPIIRGGQEYYITPRLPTSYQINVSYAETSQFRLGRSHFERKLPASNDGGYRLAKHTVHGGEIWLAQPPCIQFSVSANSFLMIGH
jgi:hypothetical protein